MEFINFRNTYEIHEALGKKWYTATFFKNVLLKRDQYTSHPSFENEKTVNEFPERLQ